MNARAALLIAVAAVAGACATERREPIFAAAGLDTRPVKTVTVAPVVEERAFPETQAPLVSYVMHAAERVLENKGYDARAAETGPVQLDAPLLDARGGVLAAAAPAAAGPYSLWIALERVDMDNTDIGLDTRVRVSGVLLDAERGEILWRDRAERESSISGQGFATISPSVRTYEAVYAAVGSLLESLPDRPD
jgi:hypothetical protein